MISYLTHDVMQVYIIFMLYDIILLGYHVCISYENMKCTHHIMFIIYDIIVCYMRSYKLI
jgi:hypothetical protein